MKNTNYPLENQEALSGKLLVLKVQSDWRVSLKTESELPARRNLATLNVILPCNRYHDITTTSYQV